MLASGVGRVSGVAGIGGHRPVCCAARCLCWGVFGGLGHISDRVVLRCEAVGAKTTSGFTVTTSSQEMMSKLAAVVNIDYYVMW